MCYRRLQWGAQLCCHREHAGDPRRVHSCISNGTNLLRHLPRRWIQYPNRYCCLVHFIRKFIVDRYSSESYKSCMYWYSSIAGRPGRHDRCNPWFELVGSYTTRSKSKLIGCPRVVSMGPSALPTNKARRWCLSLSRRQYPKTSFQSLLFSLRQIQRP